MLKSLFKKKEQSLNKILIIRFSSIGDIVLTTPIIRCIKKTYPDCTLHYLTKIQFKQVISANPYIDYIHTFDNNIKETIEELKLQNFDIIIDLHCNLRSKIISRSIKVKTYGFPKLNFKKWVYVNLKWNLLPNYSIVSRYFKAVNKINVFNDGEGLDYFIPEHQSTKNDDIPMSHWAGYVACVIGGSYETKKFPLEKWKEFCLKCNFPIILLGGSEDKNMGDQIAEVDNIKIYNACGKFSLNESAHLVKRSVLVISNDTGLMHIAAAYQKPIISLWGNTTPKLGMFPYYGNNDLNHIISSRSKLIEINYLSCRPCSKIGYRKCPKRHFKCMNDVQTEDIKNQVDQFWKSYH